MLADLSKDAMICWPYWAKLS